MIIVWLALAFAAGALCAFVYLAVTSQLRLKA